MRTQEAAEAAIITALDSAGLERAEVHRITVDGDDPNGDWKIWLIDGDGELLAHVVVDADGEVQGD